MEQISQIETLTTDERIFQLICMISAITGRDLEDVKNEGCLLAGVDPNIIKIVKVDNKA